jgi:hypothetical protein
VKVRRKRLAYNDSMRYVARPLRYSLIETDELIRLAADNTQMSLPSWPGPSCPLRRVPHPALQWPQHSPRPYRHLPLLLLLQRHRRALRDEPGKRSGSGASSSAGQRPQEGLQHITFCGFDETGATDTPPADDAPNTSESATGSAAKPRGDAQAM